jgi:hypothetical protein
MQQIMLSVSNNITVPEPRIMIVNGDNVIDSNVWTNFVYTLRYIGGASNAAVANLVANDDTPGPVINNFVSLPPGGGVFTGANQPHNVNAAANFTDFRGVNSRTNIAELGNGNLMNGFREVREFSTTYFPTISEIFRHIAEIPLTSANGGVTGLNTALGGNAAVRDEEALYIAYFFNNNIDLMGVVLGQLGINNPIDLNAVQAELNALYDPLNTNINFALPAGVQGETIRNNTDTKASFGVCPHVAFKAGYFVDELKACLYVKLGMIRLNGHVVPVNNIYGLQKEKFGGIAPFIALGIIKNIDCKWGMAVELSHAFKITKNLQKVKIFNQTIENHTNISRSGIRIMAIYRL